MVIRLQSSIVNAYEEAKYGNRNISSPVKVKSFPLYRPWRPLGL
jgi:hypothetical protein